ncbi:hypothetical protein BC831DRAFT_484408 [Entophlyctis helioformis]|nr:hypothetical protein BC831DRAFT_496366 [Entophlyctis helioformis]KAI8917948.1 hypothetical protein BC831DRAFT_484408 [Entophlyctis helioformis]
MHILAFAALSLVGLPAASAPVPLLITKRDPAPIPAPLPEPLPAPLPEPAHSVVYESQRLVASSDRASSTTSDDCQHNVSACYGGPDEPISDMQFNAKAEQLDGQ